MSNLLEFLDIAEDKELENIVNLIEADLSAKMAKYAGNPVGEFEPKDEEVLFNKMDTTVKRLLRIRNELGAANKLKDPAERKNAKSNLMKSINYLNLIQRDINQMLDIQNKNWNKFQKSDQFLDTDKVYMKTGSQSADLNDNPFDRKTNFVNPVVKDEFNKIKSNVSNKVSNTVNNWKTRAMSAANKIRNRRDPNKLDNLDNPF